MTPEQYGLIIRGNPETYSLSNGIVFKLDTLAQARHMAAPEIAEIDILLEGTAGAVTGGALGRDAAKLVDNFKFFDGEDFVNCSGAMHRLWEMQELGNRRFDPADIASGATNTTYKYRWRFPFAAIDKAMRGDDFSIPLTNLLEGGQISLNTPAAVPTGWAAVQADWKLTPYFYIRDARKKEAKARRRIREVAVTAQEFDYPVAGFLRTAILGSKLTTTGYTSLAGFTTLNSRTLMWPATMSTQELIDAYRYNTVAFGTEDEFLGSTTYALAIQAVQRGQMTGQMVDTQTLHIDLLQAAPAGGRLLTDVVTDRLGQSTAVWLGYGSPGEAQNAIKNGKVNGGDGRQYPVGEYNANLARKLPVRVGKS